MLVYYSIPRIECFCSLSSDLVYDNDSNLISDWCEVVSCFNEYKVIPSTPTRKPADAAQLVRTVGKKAKSRGVDGMTLYSLKHTALATAESVVQPGK
jgi:hypothetical protein